MTFIDSRWRLIGTVRSSAKLLSMSKDKGVSHRLPAETTALLRVESASHASRYDSVRSPRTCRGHERSQSSTNRSLLFCFARLALALFPKQRTFDN